MISPRIILPHPLSRSIINSEAPFSTNLSQEGLPTGVVSSGTDDPVPLTLVKGLDADAMFPKPVDFDAVCRACEDDTLC